MVLKGHFQKFKGQKFKKSSALGTLATVLGNEEFARNYWRNKDPSRQDHFQEGKGF